MQNSIISKEYEKLVKNRFNVYNSLFLNLPFKNIDNTGILLPLLSSTTKQLLDEGKEPLQALEYFFQTHTKIVSEEDKIDFMFQVIQYVERQVVLFDSIEDAAFSELQKFDDNLTLKEHLIQLSKSKKDEFVFKKVSDFSTRLVFTAHPTQFYTPSVLNIIAKLKNFINDNNINKIDITLKQLALTSLINSKKPTPLDEAKNIIYFLRNVYYDAAAQIYSNMKNNLPKDNYVNPSIVQFGFWPGGDRDGNPFVTSEITKMVADELRMNLMKCYYKDIKKIRKKLTFKNLEDKLTALQANIYDSMFDNKKNIDYEEIINSLQIIREILINDYERLYLDELDNLIDKVKIFKTHFATLDIRQNHSVHKKTIEEILKRENLIKTSVDELDKKELISILLNSNIKVEKADFDDELVNDTIQNISQLKEIQQKNGEEGCNRYIISNSEDIYSVLFVYSLLKWCSCGENPISMDIIPLFESIEGMANSEKIMTELFNMPEYQKHVKKRKNTQTMMLGFSDGTKDGGYLKANWSILKTKENLSKVCKENDIKAIFFDGRGGPPARGGGKAHRFYASQTDKIANNAIQLTIQGQTITSRYGTKEHFIFNFEQLLSAGLSNRLSERKNVITKKSEDLIEELGNISYQKYKALKNHNMFVPYLENKSTLKYYGKTNIGSRPTKRANKAKLDLNDLRAIPFVGSWSQLKQNVPGYFGVGTAIKELIDKGKLDELKRLFNEVPFFKALILSSMMSLSKCYFELTSYIAKDEEYNEFWNILYDEYKLSKEMTLLISGYSTLMEEEPITKKSIEIREKIVLPLLVIQQYALQKVEQNTDKKDTYEKIVKRSLYGNINASRNSV